MFFIFIPICIFWENHIYNKNAVVALLLISICTIVIIILGLATLKRNDDWKTPKKLWMSAIPHAKDQARCLQNLSAAYGDSIIDLEKKKVLNHKSIKLKSSVKGHAQYQAYKNLGAIAVQEKNLKKALKYYLKAFSYNNSVEDALRLSELYRWLGQSENSQKWLNTAEATTHSYELEKFILIYQAHIFLQKKDSIKLKKCVDILTARDTTTPQAANVIALYNLYFGNPEVALKYFKKTEHSKRNFLWHYQMLQAGYYLKNFSIVSTEIDYFFSHYPYYSICIKLNEFEKTFFYPVLDTHLTNAFLLKSLDDKINR